MLPLCFSGVEKPWSVESRSSSSSTVGRRFPCRHHDNHIRDINRSDQSWTSIKKRRESCCTRLLVSRRSCGCRSTTTTLVDHVFVLSEFLSMYCDHLCSASSRIRPSRWLVGVNDTNGKGNEKPQVMRSHGLCFDCLMQRRRSDSTKTNT